MNRYLFFLRAFNDIDNIVPAAYYLLREDQDAFVELCVYSMDYDYRADRNLRFLTESFPESTRVNWVPRLLNVREWALGESRLSKGYAAALKARGRLRHGSHVGKLFGSDPRVAEEERSAIAKQLVGGGEKPVLAVFDHNRESAVGGMVASIRLLGIPTVALPVSPVVTINTMKREDYVTRDFSIFESRHSYEIFDRIAFTDDLYLGWLREHYRRSGRVLPFDDQVSVLGSVRYCHEWLSVRSRFIPPFEFPTNRRKIVFFLSQPVVNAHWAEVQRVIALLTHYPELEIVIKPHTRKMAFDLRRRVSNISVAPAHVDSSALIDWCDTVMFWGTSIAIEAYVKKKLMLNLDFVHANRTSFETLAAGAILRSRDELKFALDDIVANRPPDPAISDSHEALVSRLVYNNDTSPVSLRYVRYLRQSANFSAAGTP